jgi:hypothetical protein
MNNNVARSHIGTIAHGYDYSIGKGGAVRTCAALSSRRGQSAAAQAEGDAAYSRRPHWRLRRRAGQLEQNVGNVAGHPLFFATDPVALDHIGWDIIDSKRRLERLPPVGEMGRHLYTDSQKIAMAMTNLGATNLRDGLPLIASEKFVRSGGDSEVFDRRQPEHVIAAGLIGLGEFDLKNITHSRIKLG